VAARVAPTSVPPIDDPPIADAARGGRRLATIAVGLAGVVACAGKGGPRRAPGHPLDACAKATWRDAIATTKADADTRARTNAARVGG
jgi:hypothetical protein